MQHTIAKVFFNMFSNGILHAPKFLKFCSLAQKNISTSEVKVGQKRTQPISHAVLFGMVFN
jgi:hypothetical protein